MTYVKLCEQVSAASMGSKMGIEFSLDDINQVLQELGISFPAWLFAIFLLLIVLNWTGAFTTIGNLLRWFSRGILSMVRPRATQSNKSFLRKRSLFVKHLLYEVERLNREADWNDFYYTELEAEVEVNPLEDLESRGVLTIVRLVPSLFRDWLGLKRATNVEDSLTSAIERSNSKVFLVIGDPGSGKTVSLRHLFLRLAENAVNTNSSNAVVPIYANLKSLNMRPEEVTADSIREWILAQVKAGQDRLIHQFLEQNFDNMLQEGQFFFLLDSFDEIPLVLDADENAEVVRQYALALNRFLHAPHSSRGLVSSRPYRSPKAFVGQKLTIRALTNNQIRSALGKYLSERRELAYQTWQELERDRSDLLQFVRNPFYLNLLARFTLDEHRLPDKHYELYEHFVEKRFQEDESRLSAISNVSCEDAIETTSFLAYEMMRQENLGLEAPESVIATMLNQRFGIQRTKGLLEFLLYAKLGRFGREHTASESEFSFVHRRFHEYFSARYLSSNPRLLTELNTNFDDRWREVLVLLCENLPSDQLQPVLSKAQAFLLDAIGEPEDKHKQQDALVTLSFLRDGFQKNYHTLPAVFQPLATLTIIHQFQNGNLLEQKRAIESTAILDQSCESTVNILEYSLNSDSQWLRETAIYSCRNMEHVTQGIHESILGHILHTYERTWAPWQQTMLEALRLARSPLLQSLFSVQKMLYILAWIRLPLLPATALYSFSMLFFLSQPKDYPPLLNQQPAASISLFLGTIIVLLSLGAFALPKRLAPHFLLARRYEPEEFRKRNRLVVLTGLAIGAGLFTVAISFYTLNTNERFRRAVELFFPLFLVLVSLLLLLASVTLMKRLASSLSRKMIGRFFRNFGAFIGGLPRQLSKELSDVSLLLKMLNQSSKRPTSTTEIIEHLGAFSTSIVTAVYSKKLLDWVPFDTGIDAIISEAEKYSGETRDNLYKLAEKWSDSMPR